MKYTLIKPTERPFLLSKNNVIFEVNDEVTKFTGYAKNELIGKSFVEVRDILKISSQVKFEDNRNEYSCYLFTKEYEPREVTISCKNLKCEDEKAYFIKEKPNSRIENRLPYAVNLLSLDEIAVAIYSIDDGVLIKANKKFLDCCDEYCNKKENRIGRTLEEMFSKYKGSFLERIFLDVAKTGKPYYSQESKLKYPKKGDNYFDIFIVPVYILGKAKYIVHTFSDITNKVKSQEKLLIKTQLDLFNKIMENIEVGFTRYTYPKFNIIDINNKTYSYLKQINPSLSSPVSIIGQNITSVYKFNRDKEAEFKMNIQSTIDGNGKPNFIYRRIFVDGKGRFLKILHQPLFGFNNQIVEIIGISIDITEEVKVKNEMEKVIKVQEELFANLSHELKTPLNVIFSANQLIELYIKNNLLEANKEKVSKNINTIKQNCYRFIKLINNMVDLSKIESGFFKLSLSNEDIVKITEDIVQSVSEYVKKKKLSIIFDTNVEEKFITCDSEKIERSILNLISNAIKFSDPDGRIFVNILDKDDRVEIVIKDTGIGIDKKHLNMIFERFHQTDKSLSRNTEGSGIGLYLVKSIIEMHGGKISVESKVGKGSIFKIQLPSKTLENQEYMQESELEHNKTEMIYIEFSDIYSI